MEEIINTGSRAATPNRTNSRPRPFFLALVLTGVLYLGVKQPSDNTAIDVSKLSQGNATLTASVESAVMEDLSQRSGLPKTALRVVRAKQLTWFDRSLNVGEAEVLCDGAPVSGWEITLVGGQKRWIYLTNTSGSVVKLDNAVPSHSKAILEVAIGLKKR